LTDYPIGAAVGTAIMGRRRSDKNMPSKPVKAPMWLPDVEKQDYLGANSYLNLMYPAKQAKRLVARLRAATLVPFKAKDIFRASRLSLLGVSNSHVERDFKKITHGVALSPILLVREEQNRIVLIADGYHRLCAVYQSDEDATIPCKIV
jgi:hypothetical protein